MKIKNNMSRKDLIAMWWEKVFHEVAQWLISEEIAYKGHKLEKFGTQHQNKGPVLRLESKEGNFKVAILANFHFDIDPEVYLTYKKKTLSRFRAKSYDDGSTREQERLLVQSIKDAMKEL